MIWNKINEEDIDEIRSRAEVDKAFKNSTILITGCAGFLGYYFILFFTRHAQELGIKKIIGVDNFQVGHPQWLDEVRLEYSEIFTFSQFDVIHDRIENIMHIQEVDYVIHMASIASPTFYRKYPIETLDANVWGLRYLLEYFKDRSLRGLLMFSSSEIYGDPPPEEIPTQEDYRGHVATIGPRACYDEAKRFSETMCYLFSKKYDMTISLARPFNNYGPGMSLNDKRAPADFAQAIVNNKDINIFSDGQPTRTFCYVSDAICGYLKVLTHGQFDYFNVGIDKPEITIGRLAEIFVEAGKEIFNYTGKINYPGAPDKDYLKHNPNRRCPNLKKSRELLKYDPIVDVEVGVRRFLQFIKYTGGAQ